MLTLLRAEEKEEGKGKREIRIRKPEQGKSPSSPGRGLDGGPAVAGAEADYFSQVRGLGSADLPDGVRFRGKRPEDVSIHHMAAFYVTRISWCVCEDVIVEFVRSVGRQSVSIAADGQIISYAEEPTGSPG